MNNCGWISSQQKRRQNRNQTILTLDFKIAGDWFKIELIQLFGEENDNL